MSIAAAGTVAALAVHFGPKLARVAFSTLDGKRSQAEFDERGLDNRVGIIPFNGENGSSNRAPHR